MWATGFLKLFLMVMSLYSGLQYKAYIFCFAVCQMRKTSKVLMKRDNVFIFCILRMYFSVGVLKSRRTKNMEIQVQVPPLPLMSSKKLYFMPGPLLPPLWSGNIGCMPGCRCVIPVSPWFQILNQKMNQAKILPLLKLMWNKLKWPKTSYLGCGKSDELKNKNKANKIRSQSNQGKMLCTQKGRKTCHTLHIASEIQF